MSEQFCDECDVSMDLHSGEDTCESAAMKAGVIGMFFGRADR